MQKYASADILNKKKKIQAFPYSISTLQLRVI